MLERMFAADARLAEEACAATARRSRRPSRLAAVAAHAHLRLSCAHASGARHLRGRAYTPAARRVGRRRRRVGRPDADPGAGAAARPLPAGLFERCGPRGGRLGRLHVNDRRRERAAGAAALCNPVARLQPDAPAAPAALDAPDAPPFQPPRCVAASPPAPDAPRPRRSLCARARRD